MSSGQYLKNEDMDKLLRRSSDPKEYPYTLQVQRGESVGGIQNPIMVSTVHEQDYYLREGDEYVISGISLAIVLDPRNEDNSRLTTSLDDQIVEEYGRQTISKLYEYFNNELRKFIKVETGIFGADMNVTLSNIGPTTILLEM